MCLLHKIGGQSVTLDQLGEGLVLGAFLWFDVAHKLLVDVELMA